MGGISFFSFFSFGNVELCSALCGTLFRFNVELCSALCGTLFRFNVELCSALCGTLFRFNVELCSAFFWNFVPLSNSSFTPSMVLNFFMACLTFFSVTKHLSARSIRVHSQTSISASIAPSVHVNPQSPTHSSGIFLYRAIITNL